MTGSGRCRLPRDCRPHPLPLLLHRRRHYSFQRRPRLCPAPHPAPRRPHGRILGFKEPFFYKLADTVAENFGDAFPELRKNRDRVRKTLKAEEDPSTVPSTGVLSCSSRLLGGHFPTKPSRPTTPSNSTTPTASRSTLRVMAAERGLAVDDEGFEKLMNEQRELARADHASKKSVVLAEGGAIDAEPTRLHRL